MNLFMLLVLMYDLKLKVRNDARVMPSSDHRVYISCTRYLGCITDLFESAQIGGW